MKLAGEEGLLGVRQSLIKNLRIVTYSKLCYTLQHIVKLRGLLRGRA